MSAAGDIRILADDLTGALDTAAAFAGVVPVFIDRPPGLGAPYDDAPLTIVATPTRDVDARRLPELLGALTDWLAAGGVAFKKVDSLLRGNTFAEIAYFMASGRFAQALFAPAFPQQGRITADDRQWLIKPELPCQAVATPLCETFARFGLSSSAADAQVWIPDVRSDDDLDRVVAAAEPSAKALLWCGSAGLAQALARRRGLAPVAGAAAPLPRASGPTLLVSASYQPVVREQWAHLLAAARPDALARQARPDEIAQAIERARAGGDQLWFDLSPEARLTPAQAAELLSAHSARLLGELPVPAQLVVVGGDTLLALCRAAGARALLAHPAVRPGWGCARLVGGRWDGVPCYSRSGAFGGADDLSSMIRLLSGSENRRKGS